MNQPITDGTAIDAVGFELLTNALTTVVDEMAGTLLRTSHSNNVRDGLDFATCVFDPEGRLIAQGLSIPFHIGQMHVALEQVRLRFEGEIQPGDVYAVNDPYSGGSHLTDIFMFKPIFLEDRLLLFLGIVADYVDIGGRSPGGRGLDSRDIYWEGLRLPPIRLIDRGRPASSIWDIIATNVRVPEKVIGDLNACLAGFSSAGEMVGELLEKYGESMIRRYFVEAMDYSERMVRRTIAELPRGTYEFTDYVDDSIVDDAPVTIHVKLDTRGTDLYFDFTGSAPVVASAINATFSITQAACYAAVATLLPPERLINAGFFKPIRVYAPPGTVTHATAPAAVASRGVTALRILDAVFGVLAQVMPDRIPAAGEGGATAVRISGRDSDRGNWIVWDTIIGTWGGRPDRDGVDGCASYAANPANVPVENLEAEYPIRILRYGLRDDSGGPGRFRGGLGLQREWQLLAPEAVAIVRADRTKFRPWPLKGGRPGEPSRNTLNSGINDMVLPAKFERTIKAGDRILHEQASGAGYGDPLERDPELVLRDVLNDKVRLETAQNVHGVILDLEERRVDREATDRQRIRLRNDSKRAPAHSDH